MKKRRILPLILFTAFLITGCSSKNKTESSTTVREEISVSAAEETTTTTTKKTTVTTTREAPVTTTEEPLTTTEEEPLTTTEEETVTTTEEETVTTTEEETVTTTEEETVTTTEEETVTTTEETPISPHKHSFGEWVSVDENSHEQTCECGEKQTAEHRWDDGVLATKPTCTEDGKMKYTCKDCGANKYVTVEKTGHLMAYVSDSDSHWVGCTHDGCDYTEGDKEAHVFVANADYTLQTCSCGYSRTMYRLDITHDDTFIIGESVDFTYTAAWNGDSKIEISELSYRIGDKFYTSEDIVNGYQYSDADDSQVQSSDSNEVSVHLYLNPLSGSEFSGSDFSNEDNQNDFFSRVKVFYNGIEMTGYSSMWLYGTNCPHFEITDWGENAAPTVKESE